MSISNSLSNALSGLTAAARAAEVVSANVANADTPSYGRRVLSLAAGVVGDQGAGVRVVGVTRDIDQAVLADRRIADADNARAETLAGFYTTMEGAFGLPGQPGSLTGTLDAFSAALVTASALPDSDSQLLGVVDAAKAVAGKLNQTATAIQTARQDADTQIAVQVDLLNDRLAKIADLNHQIRLLTGAGNDANALMDQRQALVDDVASIVPLSVSQRELGSIAIYTAGGAALLDGQPAAIAFQRTPTIVPQMTDASGGLSQVTINGNPVDTLAGGNALAGGDLAALFQIRDGAAVDMQAQLDAFARDLTERFQAPGPDPTVTTGLTGLFTDATAVFTPANEVGLAQRITLNAAVDPDQGGALWRLRDGLHATAQGPVGNAVLLTELADAMAQPRTPSSGALVFAARSSNALAAELVSLVGQQGQSAAKTRVFTETRLQALRQAELADGVDTDQEMQNLLRVEQAFAANARVVQTLDELLQSLLRI